MAKKQYRAAQFIEAIQDSGGIISEIARRIGCTWHTARSYIEDYATVAQAYEDECERVADMAESVIVKAIDADDIQTAKWYLARIRKGKYSERQEITGEDGRPVKLQVEYVNDWRNPED